MPEIYRVKTPLKQGLASVQALDAPSRSQLPEHLSSKVVRRKDRLTTNSEQIGEVWGALAEETPGGGRGKHEATAEETPGGGRGRPQAAAEEDTEQLRGNRPGVESRPRSKRRPVADQDPPTSSKPVRDDQRASGAQRIREPRADERASRRSTPTWSVGVLTLAPLCSSVSCPV